MDPRLARYPFLPAAAEWTAREGPSLDEMLGDPVYAGARRLGRERVRLALEDAALPARPLTDASSPRELLEETLAYAYARILVSALGDAYAVRRHALAEAVRARDHLAREEDARVVAECAEAVGLEFHPDGDKFRAHFTEYLRHAVHLKDLSWKLVKQPLRGGVVEMDRETTARLVQEGLRRRIESELPKPLPPDLVKRLEADLAPLRAVLAAKKEALPVAQFGAVDLRLIPPCMSRILGELQGGVNVAHNARFAIVTFLHKIGMTSEGIMALFAQAPDFREDLTRYQVEHITGVTSGTTYNVPGCDNLQTFNLCHANELCRSATKAGAQRVRYPGDYYRYMQEAKPVADAVAAKVPLANPEQLLVSVATLYGLLKKLESATAGHAFARLDPKAVVRAVREKGIPVKLDGEGDDARLVFDGSDPWSIVRLLESEWVQAASS